MQRYFSKNEKLELNKDDIHHITNVMRMKKNDKIEIVYNNEVFLCNLDNVEKDNISYSILEKININNELNKKITIAFGLVNENKTDYIIQKCTELGAYSFIPLKLKNSKIKLDNKEDKKNIRWNKISKEAAEQSFRNLHPKVYSSTDLKELIKKDFDLKLIASTKEKEKSIKNVLQNSLNYDTIIIVVGPEGGIDPSEEDFLVENGYKRVNLGDSILRCETAPLFIMSCIRYELMR